MPRKIFAFALPLICSLSSMSSFASVTLTAGHANFTTIPPLQTVFTAVVIETPAPLAIYHIDLPPQNTTVFETWVTLTPSITLTTDHYANSGTMSTLVSHVSAVPLAGGGVYLAGALLPLAARLLRRRR